MEAFLAILTMIRDFFVGLGNFIAGTFFIGYILLAPASFAMTCLALIALFGLYSSLKESIINRFNKYRHGE